MQTKHISSPDYTAEYGDAKLLCNCTSNDIAITLFPSLEGHDITIKKTESSDNTVTITAYGSQKIDGFSSVKLWAKDAFYTLAGVSGGWTVVDKPSIVHFHIPAVLATAADTDGIHAAVTDNGQSQTITAAITQPSVPRNITATAGGTGGDVKAIRVTVNGTNYLDEVISEQLPAFTVNTPGSVVGAKAFKTITSIVIPAHDGTGATTAIGFGEVFGLWDKLAHSTVLATYFNNAIEETDPTVVVSATAVENNTIDINSTPDGEKAIDAYYIP